MQKTPFLLWLNALVGEFIEGSADAFLIVSGGSALSQSGAVALPTITPQQLLYSVLLGGAWYAAAFLKKTPTPTSIAQAPAAVPLASRSEDVPVRHDPLVP